MPRTAFLTSVQWWNKKFRLGIERHLDATAIILLGSMRSHFYNNFLQSGTGGISFNFMIPSMFRKMTSFFSMYIIIMFNGKLDRRHVFNFFHKHKKTEKKDLHHITVYWLYIHIRLYISMHKHVILSPQANTQHLTSLIARFMGPIWGRQDPSGPHVAPMNFAIGDAAAECICHRCACRYPSRVKHVFNIIS